MDPRAYEGQEFQSTTVNGKPVLDEELPTPKSRLPPPSLDRLGVAELQAYISELRTEISRVEAEIARKQDHRSAADDVFRRT